MLKGWHVTTRKEVYLIVISGSKQSHMLGRQDDHHCSRAPG